MKRLVCILAALLLSFGLVALSPGAARADDENSSSNDNSAIAVNTKDGSSVFKLAFAIREVAGDVVDSTNAAVAYASCNDCQTVAIAIQIVFVIGSPSVVTPTNVAVAVNENCTSCQTLALAYQFVVGVPGPVKFTHEGRREIEQIRSELEQLKHSDLPIAVIRERVAALMARLKVVLKTQLRAKKGGRGHIQHGEAGSSNNSSANPPQDESTQTTETTEVPQDTTETATVGTDTTQTDTTQTETTTTPTTP